MTKYKITCEDNPLLKGLTFIPSRTDTGSGIVYGTIVEKPGKGYWFKNSELEEVND